MLAELRVEALRQYQPVIDLLSLRSRSLWVDRFQLAPESGDPRSWRGRVSRRMRKDWIHASKLLTRGIRSASLDKASDTR